MRRRFPTSRAYPGGLLIALVAAAYCLAAAAGGLLTLTPGGDSVIWPPAGVALALLLILGGRAWPGVFLGALLTRGWLLWPEHGLPGAGMALAWAGMAASAAFQAWLGGWLILRYVGDRNPLSSFANTLLFLAIGALTSLLGALGSLGSLYFAGLMDLDAFLRHLALWWMGDGGGVLLFASGLLACYRLGWPDWPPETWAEALAYLGLVLLCSLGVFAWWHPTGDTTYPIDMLMLPLVAWSAFRFTQREISLTLLLILLVAVWGTRGGGGPYMGFSAFSTLLVLQAFIDILAAVSLSMGAVMAEQRKAKDDLQQQQELLEQQVRIRTLALEQSHAEVLAMSRSDMVTGIANRRCFEESLDGEWRRAQRLGSSLGMLMIDIDYFKRYNDHYGHVSGDYCLRQVAQTIRASIRRPQDLVARYGGEEFVCLLPDTPPEGVLKVAQAVLAAVRALNMEHADSDVADIVTISIGCASQVPADGLSGRQLLETADQLLYKAKQQGRDRLAS